MGFMTFSSLVREIISNLMETEPINKFGFMKILMKFNFPKYNMGDTLLSTFCDLVQKFLSWTHFFYL